MPDPNACPGKDDLNIRPDTTRLKLDLDLNQLGPMLLQKLVDFSDGYLSSDFRLRAQVKRHLEIRYAQIVTKRSERRRHRGQGHRQVGIAVRFVLEVVCRWADLYELWVTFESAGAGLQALLIQIVKLDAQPVAVCIELDPGARFGRPSSEFHVDSVEPVTSLERRSETGNVLGRLLDKLGTRRASHGKRDPRACVRFHNRLKFPVEKRQKKVRVYIGGNNIQGLYVCHDAALT